MVALNFLLIHLQWLMASIQVQHFDEDSNTRLNFYVSSILYILRIECGCYYNILCRLLRKWTIQMGLVIITDGWFRLVEIVLET